MQQLSCPYAKNKEGNNDGQGCDGDDDDEEGYNDNKQEDRLGRSWGSQIWKGCAGARETEAKTGSRESVRLVVRSKPTL